MSGPAPRIPSAVTRLPVAGSGCELLLIQDHVPPHRVALHLFVDQSEAIRVLAAPDRAAALADTATFLQAALDAVDVCRVLEGADVAREQRDRDAAPVLADVGRHQQVAEAWWQGFGVGGGALAAGSILLILLIRMVTS